MAGVTSDILANMLRSNLNNLKSFAELLNAELTEEGQEEESRQSHKGKVSSILQRFGEAEAYFEKGVKCLRKVETDVQMQFTGENHEEIDHRQLVEEIKSIIKVVEGRERVADVEEEVNLDTNVDEIRFTHQLKNIEDILNEYHPLRIDDNEENDDSEEEEDRMCQELENMVKRAMAKLEKSLNEAVDKDDEEYVQRLEQSQGLGDSDDEEPNIAADSLERVGGPSSRANKDAEKSMNNKLNQLWDDYKKKMTNGPSLDARQLFESKLQGQPDIDFSKLQYFPKYHNTILELFSKEAVVVLEEKTTYTDPITKMAIQNPVRNKICHHIYERDTIYEILGKKKEIRCPFVGCTCRSFTLNDVVEDEEAAEKITQNQAKQQKREEQQRQRASTSTTVEEDDTLGVNSDDDTQTLSQEIL